MGRDPPKPQFRTARRTRSAIGDDTQNPARAVVCEMALLRQLIRSIRGRNRVRNTRRDEGARQQYQEAEAIGCSSSAILYKPLLFNVDSAIPLVQWERRHKTGRLRLSFFMMFSREVLSGLSWRTWTGNHSLSIQPFVRFWV